MLKDKTMSLALKVHQLWTYLTFTNTARKLQKIIYYLSRNSIRIDIRLEITSGNPTRKVSKETTFYKIMENCLARSMSMGAITLSQDFTVLTSEAKFFLTMNKLILRRTYQVTTIHPLRTIASDNYLRGIT